MDVDLFKLVRRCDLAGVKQLIQQDVGYVTATNGRNQTALCIACTRGHTAIAQYLLDCGAPVSLGENPLIAAVRFNRYHCVEPLLKHHADVNCTDARGNSPLSVALRKRHYSIILLLLQYGAVPSLSLRYEAFQIIKHANVEHAEIITELLDDSIINLSSECLFLALFGYAFRRGILEIAERLLPDDSCSQPAGIEQLYPAAAYYSAKHQWLAILSALLEKRFDVNALTEGQTALYVACKKGCETIVNLLLVNGADPNVRNESLSSQFQLPIQIAVHDANIVIFNLLLEHGADLHQIVIEPLLHIACSPVDERKTDSVECPGTRSAESMLHTVRLLLEHGVTVDAVSDKGDTAIYRACRSQQLEAVHSLVEAGADVNLTRRHLYPVIAAHETGNAELINVLLDAGADVTCSNNVNETCLHVVVRAFAMDPQKAPSGPSISTSDVIGTIKSLLQRGVNVDASCSQEETVLYRASKAGHEDIVRVLLEAGAETHGSSNRRPLYAACEHGHTQIVDLLLQHGADPNLLSTFTDFQNTLTPPHQPRQCSAFISFPVCSAMKNGYMNIVNLLLKHGADVNEKDSFGRTGLLYLIARLVFQNGAVVDQESQKQDFDTLKYMLLKGGDVNLCSSDGSNALHLASLCGRCDIMEQLMQHGADCNRLTVCGNSAVDLACERGHEAAVGLLLNSGARPETKEHSSQSGEPAICLAAKNNNETIVNLLMQHGVDVNCTCANGDTPLHLTRSITISETLLKAGANVAAVNHRGETALSKLCSDAQASVNVVEILLKFGADPNGRLCGADPNVHYPLQDACENNSVDIVRKLLEHGADANLLKQSNVLLLIDCNFLAEVVRGPSPLCVACINGNLPIVDYLLRHDASVEYADTGGNTPLHFAVERLEDRTTGDIYDPILTLLLHHKAPVDVISDKGETPLYVACRKGLVGVVKQLLACRADVGHSLSGSAKNPLLVACKKKFRDIAVILLNRGADPNVTENQQTPLELAITNGDSELVKEFLFRGADVTQRYISGDTALHVAVVPREHVSVESFLCIVTMLLKSGAVPNAFNSQCETPLSLASRRANEVSFEIFQALLEYGADPNLCPSGSSPDVGLYPPPLLAAVLCSNTRLMSMLIHFGARLDRKDNQGRTVLHYAVECNESWYMAYAKLCKSDASAVGILLSAGAEVNVIDKTGDSPLYLACIEGNTECVRLLLNYNANPNTGTQNKYPLLAACQSQCYDTLKLLLESNVDLNVSDENGKTALHHVLEANCADNDIKTAIVELLLDETGTDINAASADGETPLYVACSKGLLLVVDRMVECGARVNAPFGEKLPLNAACWNNHLQIVQLLLGEGANPNHYELVVGSECFDSKLPLVIAASSGSCELVALLLKHGANINAVDDSGNTALHCAIENYNSAPGSLRNSGVKSAISSKLLIDILLKNKADVNIINARGETPLYMASSNGLMDVVSRMLKACAGNPNQSPPDKHPLTVACKTKNVQLVDLLHEYGADPNLGSISWDQNHKNEFPLCVAIKKDSNAMVMSLLKAGALVNVMNSNGKTTLCLAVENLIHSYYRSSERHRKRFATVRLLLDHGADTNSLMPDGHSLLHLLLNALAEMCCDDPDDQALAYLIDLIQLFVKYGVKLDDSESNLREGDYTESSNARAMRAFLTFDNKSGFLVDLFRAGAGFQLLGFCCDAVQPYYPERVESISLCQAAVLAGYKPSAEEMQELQHEIASDDDDDDDDDDDVVPLVELLDWLNDDRRQVPSLQRQCRIAIRRQLSSAANFCTMLPAIDRLPLPNDLKLYLQFDGPMTEVDQGRGQDITFGGA